MGWKDALQSVRAGLAGLYPGAHAQQGESLLRETRRKKACGRVAACQSVRSEVSSGINNIGNNVLLNLEVDPGEREINSLLGVAVCYETGQMTTYPIIMSRRFFMDIVGNLKALAPHTCNEKVMGAGGT